MTSAQLDRLSYCLHRALRTVELLRELGTEEENEFEGRYSNDGFVLRDAGITLYKASTELLTSELTESGTAQLYQNEICSSDRVAAYLRGDAIHVRTPILGNRQSRNQTLEKDIMYADSVSYAIRTASNFGEYDFSVFQSKIIVFLFVFSEQRASQGRVPDCDNINIKGVLDSIANYLPGGDTPLSTALYLTTFISDELEEGTYICVRPASKGIPVVKAMLQFWAATEYWMEKAVKPDENRPRI